MKQFAGGRWQALILALVLACTAAGAQQLPEAPSRLLDKEAVLALGAMYGAIAADSLTTRHALASGNCVETSPLYGPNPSLRKQILITSAEVAGMTAVTLLFKRMLRRNTDGTRRAWLLFPGILAGAHGLAAFANARNRCY